MKREREAAAVTDPNLNMKLLHLMICFFLCEYFTHFPLLTTAGQWFFGTCAFFSVVFLPVSVVVLLSKIVRFLFPSHSNLQFTVKYDEEKC